MDINPTVKKKTKVPPTLLSIYSSSMIQITQPLHAAILVSNLEQSEQFYGTILGLKKVERPLNFPGTWYQVGDFQIHLIVAPEVIPDQVNPDKWGRNRHLAFAVTDLEAAKQQLIISQCPVQMSGSGRAALFTQDPDHNLIELSQA